MAAEVDHPLCARLYVRQSQQAERLGLAARRAQLLDGLAGKVLEVGAGNGLNFAHYPASVTGVVAVEPERHLRELAVRAARDAPVPVSVVDAIAEQLPFASAEFDAAVASLMLCSVADVGAALAELHRVLRPEGEMRSSSTSPLHDQRCGGCSEWPTPPSGRGCRAAATSGARPTG